MLSMAVIDDAFWLGCICWRDGHLNGGEMDSIPIQIPTIQTESIKKMVKFKRGMTSKNGSKTRFKIHQDTKFCQGLHCFLTLVLKIMD